MKPASNPKSLAKQIAKQVAQEPIEILKTAREQTIGSERPGQQETQTVNPSEQKVPADGQKEQVDKLKSVRRVEALNRELSDIRRQDLFKDLQKRISRGEEVPLEDYPELLLEQKQVLKAQMEAYQNQKLNIKNQNQRRLVEPAAKKGRQLFNFGKKTAVKREQTHVEKIVPPSG